MARFFQTQIKISDVRGSEELVVILKIFFDAVIFNYLSLQRSLWGATGEVPNRILRQNEKGPFFGRATGGLFFRPRFVFEYNQLILSWLKSQTVNPGEHWIFFFAFPISAGNFTNLKASGSISLVFFT